MPSPRCRRHVNHAHVQLIDAGTLGCQPVTLCELVGRTWIMDACPDGGRTSSLRWALAVTMRTLPTTSASTLSIRRHLRVTSAAVIGTSGPCPAEKARCKSCALPVYTCLERRPLCPGRHGFVMNRRTSWDRMRSPVGAFVVVALLTGTVLVGCASAGRGGASAASSTTGATPPSTTPAPSTTTTEQPGWTPVSSAGNDIAVDEMSVTGADGSQVTVARFRVGRTVFALHVGSQDPPTGSTPLGPDAGPAVGATERPNLLAAFNGGFMISDKVGGFEIGGHTLSPLVPGVASFVIDTNGSGHVGVWDQDLPMPGEQVADVRQNLSPLVSAGQLSPRIATLSAWGPPLGGVPTVARSALGEDAQGDILYAGSMSALPVDLGSALVRAGATSAMELDINPEWVQLALAAAPGGALSAGVPGQHRPADQYLTGWTRGLRHRAGGAAMRRRDPWR